MILWEDYYYDKKIEKIKILFICDSCKIKKYIVKQTLKRKK